MTSKLLLFASAMVCSTFSLLAKDYHVNNQAKSSDETGSLEHPYLTISDASAVMVAGDICYIHEGVYRETIDPINSGTSGNPIIYAAYGDDNVIVTATDSLSVDLQEVDVNIYEAKVEMDLGDRNMVYLNGEKMQIARWPNDKDGDPFTIDAIKINQKGTFSSFYSPDIPNKAWTGAYLYYLGAHSGCSLQEEITSFGGGTVRFNELSTLWPSGTHNPARFENKHYGTFYIYNSIHALDTLNEWYYGDGKLSLYLNREQIKDATIEYAKRTATATIDKDYIVLEGLNFFGAGVYVKGDNFKITECRVKQGSNMLLVPRQSSGKSNAVGSDAAISILSNANNATIEKCIVEYGDTNGIMTSGNSSGHVINNNIVRYFDFIGNHSTPVRLTSPTTHFSNNTVKYAGRDGSRMSGENSRFSYNDVSHALKICSDGGLFYITGSSTDKDIELDHNWFYEAYSPESYSGLKANGIYLDNNSGGYDVHHNVVWRTQWRAVQMNWTAVYNNIHNNTFWDVGEGQETFGCWIPCKTKDPSGNCLERHDVRDNVIYNNLSDVRTWWLSVDGSFTEDETLDNDFQNNFQSSLSPFENFEEQNFMLKSGSSMVDKGKIISGVNDGTKLHHAMSDVSEKYTGAAPDIGAYEVGGVNWKPGSSLTYEEFVWDDNGVELKFDTIAHPEVSEPTAISQTSGATIEVYPNPLENGTDLTIKSSDPILEIVVRDINGRELEKVNPSDFQTSQVSLLTPDYTGIALVSVSTIKGVEIIKLLMK
ncbi:hypothetical protein [Reichenbachiella versicolor]|uniref:hypothetical protein n=1 Tax=Reichenbachiella versicolor TaxID=1821036 RepID=UPI0013A57BFB|nr:hypothetical protein [Reichenbachiella versicolor]